MEPATGGQKGVFMAIAEQFAGLQMDQLIGAPLRAAADASNQLANSTAEFINRVGFDANGNVQTVAFGYQRRSVNEDGISESGAGYDSPAGGLQLRGLREAWEYIWSKNAWTRWSMSIRMI